MSLIQLIKRISFSRSKSIYLSPMNKAHASGEYIPSRDLLVRHSEIQCNHLLIKTANSIPQNECCILDTYVWPRETKLIPNLTGILRACVACNIAGRRWGPPGKRGKPRSLFAICSGSRDCKVPYEPILKASRIYARPSNAVDVKGTGPFGFLGSRLDSGARCHWEVHARRKFLDRLVIEMQGIICISYRISSFWETSRGCSPSLLKWNARYISRIR